MSEIPFPPLKLALCPHSLAVTSQLYLDHSHCPVLAPAALAALTSTPAIPDRDVFYVALPFTPLKLVRCPHSLAPTLVALPSMSLIPSAPFDDAGARNGPILARCCAREHVKRPSFLAL